MRVNRELSGDIYLGVRAVVPDGDRFRLADGDDPAAVEHVVEMRRFDAARTLRSAVEQGRLDLADLDRVAATVAAFHDRAPRVDAPHAAPEAASAAKRAVAAEDVELTALLTAPDVAILHAATPDVGRAQEAVAEPLDEVPADRLLMVRTDRPVTAVALAVAAALDA
ncbi:MAG: hypothetical protein AB7G37_00050 [Solirubrobacteraceae bacterium]